MQVNNEPTYYSLNQTLLMTFVALLRTRYSDSTSERWQRVFYLSGKLPLIIDESLLEIIEQRGSNIDDLEKLEQSDEEVVELVTHILKNADDESLVNPQYCV